MIRSVLITINKDLIPKDLFGDASQLLFIPQQAVAILGNGDSFSEGICKFI